VAGRRGVLEKAASAADGRVLRSRALSREREFERLYRESYGMVYNYVRYRMPGDAAAEDVVAEAYLRAARAFDGFDPARSKFSTWVTTIASNCMRDHWRRSRPSVGLEEVPDKVFSQPDAVDDLADRDMVDRLLSVLSEEERNLVVMKYREGYRNVEIAAELDMNPSTVSTRIFNAMAKMRSVASGW
jgi:RNA polymerase sigma-70 factor (ECF subfamily)